MITARGTWLLVGVAVLAGAGWFVWGSGARPEPKPEQQAIEPKAQPEAPKPAVPAVAPLPAPVPKDIPEKDYIAYPDGTRLPPLNGVKKAPTMVFHRLMPFTKVVRKEVDRATGLEWYIHENGVRSTTRLQANGEAVSEIEKPTAPAPVANDK